MGRGERGGVSPLLVVRNRGLTPPARQEKASELAALSWRRVSQLADSAPASWETGRHDKAGNYQRLRTTHTPAPMPTIRPSVSPNGNQIMRSGCLTSLGLSVKLLVSFGGMPITGTGRSVSQSMELRTKL